MAHSIDPATGAVRGFVPARNDEERYLMRHIEDLADAAFSRGIARYSAFLSDREQDLARAALGRAGVRDGWRFDGGWPEAERRVLCLEPEYSYGECPVRCVQLQCRALPGAALPAHKDYLGSLMGLEIRREALGDIVYVTLPQVGEEVATEDSVAEVESTKSVSEVYAPLSGVITAVNEQLTDAPDTVNKDPYGDGWLFEVQLTDAGELDDLLDADAYAAIAGE